MDHENQERLRQETVTDDGGGTSLFEDVATLIDDGRNLVEAELAFQKARLSYAGRRGGSAAIFAVLALLLLLLFLFALVVGCILALTPMLGAWGAMFSVAGALLVFIAICGMLVLRNVRMIGKTFRDEA